MEKTIIGVIGSSKADKEEMKFARSLGEEIAKRGYVLLTGGRGGVMRAACRGAKKKGGLTVGILPSGNKSEANKFTDIVIPSRMGSTRNSLNALTADYIIAVGGGAGTLTEIVYAWLYGKPILATRKFGGWAKKLAGKRIDEKRSDKIVSFASPNDALEWIDEKERS